MLREQMGKEPVTTVGCGWGRAGAQVLRGIRVRVRVSQHYCITGLNADLQSQGQGLGHEEMGTASPEGPLAPSEFPP